MERLVATLLSQLASGPPAPELLDQLGEPDPAKAASSIHAAATHADLAPLRERWLPTLLATARPGFAAQCLEDLATRYRETRGTALDLARYPALPRVLGSSDFLARLLLRHPHWCEELEGDLPGAPTESPDADWTSIRIAKYKGLLRIAARDLCGRPFGDGLDELSGLADRCLTAAMDATGIELDGALPALLALGKLGGRELNFSSDVDLLFLWEPGKDGPGPEAHRTLTKFIQSFKKNMEVASDDGFAYRVDLDLRPEGRAGALINSVESALTYYESFGADWERQMLIRLRPIAGDAAAAGDFSKQVTPFVFRQLVDPAAIRAIRDMKLRIEAERTSAGRDLEIELKEGPGGIRDVEFLLQAFQLLFGGREPSLRTGNVLEGLAELGALQLLPENVTASLSDAYLWLRRAEHAVQMVEERQTQRFPRDPAAQLGLARRMGYTDASGAQARDRMLDDWTQVRAEVRTHFSALILETPDA